MDIKIKTDDLKFKFRVSAVFIHDGKLLVDKYRTEESYCLPGGYVNLGETSSEGMIREIKEETNLDFKVVKFMGIIENFFTNFDKDKTHEIADLQNFDLNKIENDNGFIIHHHFKWIELSKLNECNLLPNSIKEDILNDTGIFHYVIKED